jgi:hypothetical protein
MRARAAYISSFGTGGIIVASALLMLATVSALVAFHGWPGGHMSGGSVASVPVAPSAGPAPDALRQVRSASLPTASATSGPPSTRRVASRRAVSTEGLYKADATQVVATAPSLVKVPPTSGPQAPPVQQPPPSTGPQQPSAPAQQAPRRPPPPSEPGEELITLPSLPMAPPPPDVNDPTGNVVGTLPAPAGGEQEALDSLAQG